MMRGPGYKYEPKDLYNKPKPSSWSTYASDIIQDKPAPYLPSNVDDDYEIDENYDEYQELLDEVDEWRRLAERAQDDHDDAVAKLNKVQRELVDVRAALEKAQEQLDFADVLARRALAPVVTIEAEFFGDTLEVCPDLVIARDNYIEERGLKR